MNRISPLLIPNFHRKLHAVALAAFSVALSGCADLLPCAPKPDWSVNVHSVGGAPFACGSAKVHWDGAQSYATCRFEGTGPYPSGPLHVEWSAGAGGTYAADIPLASLVGKRDIRSSSVLVALSAAGVEVAFYERGGSHTDWNTNQCRVDYKQKVLVYAVPAQSITAR